MLYPKKVKTYWTNSPLNASLNKHSIWGLLDIMPDYFLLSVKINMDDSTLINDKDYRIYISADFCPQEINNFSCGDNT